MIKFHVKSGITVGVLFGFITLTLLFQNCSQHNFSSSTQSPSYSSGPQKVTLFASQNVHPELCLHSEIKCFKKVYSPYVKDSTEAASECVLFENKEICFPLEITNYDTSRAFELCSDCDPSANLPNGRYNRDEYTCWLSLESQNNARFYALRSDLKQALTDTLHSCLDSLPAKGDQ